MPLANTLQSPVAHPDAQAPLLRCVVMDRSGAARARLLQTAQQSRHALEIVESATVAEARTALRSAPVDLVVVDSAGPDDDGMAFVQELASEAPLNAVPVIVVSGETSEDGAIRALRSGAADYLSKDDLTVDVFDRTIEAALARTRFRHADQAAMISNLTQENETLRRITVRNMRLMKGQTMPLLAFAWRMVNGGTVDPADRDDMAKKLAKLTRNMTGLVDDTLIVSATHKANDLPDPVDLNDIVRDIISDEGLGLANGPVHLRLRALPRLKARRNQMIMLFEEMLLTAVRAGRLGQVPEIEIGSGADPEGNPIIWFREHGLHLSARKQIMAHRFADLVEPQADTARDEYSWSLCQRLVEKNNGKFRITDNGEDGSTVMVRFPREMLVGDVSEVA